MKFDILNDLYRCVRRSFNWSKLQHWTFFLNYLNIFSEHSRLCGDPVWQMWGILTEAVKYKYFWQTFDWHIMFFFFFFNYYGGFISVLKHFTFVDYQQQTTTQKRFKIPNKSLKSFSNRAHTRKITTTKVFK